MRSICVVLLALSICVLGAFASSHSEAPNTADQPIADWSDLYVFRSYEDGREDYFTILANLYPLQAPFGGPNYFTISDQFFYEIYMDTNGDCAEDIGFRFLFGSRLGGELGELEIEANDLDCSTSAPSTQSTNIGVTLPIGDKDIPIPLKFFKPVTSTDQSGLNWNEYYSVELFQGNRDSEETNPVVRAGTSNQQFVKPFDNAGTKTFPDYEAYANKYIYNIDFSDGACANGKMFVGQRADPFYITLGKIFDLLNFVPVPGFTNAIEENPLNNDLRGTNVHVIALELPIECFAPDNGVIALWTATRKLVHEEDGSHTPGAQVSRLGNPLVNEIVIGLRDKARFSHSYPTGDAANFITYVTNPTFPEILNIIYRSTVNNELGTSFSTIAPTNFPRKDLVATFLTGLEGINQDGGACEMIRINTSTPITEKDDQDNMGVINGDAAGFPNGRRPGDDVLDIALRVAMGRLCHLNLGLCEPSDAVAGQVDFTDGSPVSAEDFPAKFPYLNVPYAGGYEGEPIDTQGCDGIDEDTGANKVSNDDD